MSQLLQIKYYKTMKQNIQCHLISLKFIVTLCYKYSNINFYCWKIKISSIIFTKLLQKMKLVVNHQPFTQVTMEYITISINIMLFSSFLTVKRKIFLNQKLSSYGSILPFKKDIHLEKKNTFFKQTMYRKPFSDSAKSSLSITFFPKN